MQKVGLGSVVMAAIVLFFVIWYGIDSTNGQASPSSGNTAAGPEAVNTLEPDSEAKIVEIASKYRDLYDAVPNENEVKRTMIYDHRGAALCAALSDSSFGIRNWAGEISSMTTSSSGSVDVEIALAPHVSIGNANSIPDESKLFAILANMSVGDSVVFSGAPIRKYRGCMGEGSMTEAGSMDDPSFDASITDIRKAN